MLLRKETNQTQHSHLIKILLLVVFILFSVTLLTAQVTSGNVLGKVYDASSQDPLPGANVFVKGTSIGSATDLEGNFRIMNLSSGNYELVVSYIGYEKKVIPIIIVDGVTLFEEVFLGFDVLELGLEVTVTSQREGQAQAINQQLKSDQIVNVVSEEKIKELPDANAAESVGRLPGVAVQRDGGEASKLMIRGLDPKFSNITMNGISIPATDAERRDVDLSIISQSTLSGIELYKALTPDQDADAIAGVVNLVTGKAKSGQIIQIKSFGMYSGLTESANQYRFDAQYSNRFLDETLGLQVGANTSRRDRSRELHTDDWSVPANEDYSISSLTVQFDEEIRKRHGVNLNLDYNSNDGGNIKFINLYSYTSRNKFTSNRNYPSDGNVTYSGQATDWEISTFSNSFIGENYLGALKVNWALSHAYTENKIPFDHRLRFYEGTSTTSGMELITDRSVLKQPGVNLISYAFNAFDKATLDRAFYRESANDERNYDAKIDFEYPFTLNNNLAGIVKAGYKYRSKTRHRSSHEELAIYYVRATEDYYLNENGDIVEKDWANSYWVDGSNGLLTDYLTGYPYPSRMLDDQYLLNPLLDENRVRSWYDLNKNGISEDGKSNEYFDELSSIREQYTVNENVHGTYAMFKLNSGQILTLIGGVRYELENNEYSALYAPRIVGVFESQTAQGLKDTTSSFKKDYWLPNLHLKISPTDWMDLRFAVSKSLSRPDYLMRLPSLYINNQAQEITSGNPDIQPAISVNYDVNISFYASEYGLLTISGFRKNIDNIFYWLNDIKIMSDEQALEYGLPVEEYGPFNQYALDKPVNTEGTKVWGYEIDLQSHFGFLPGLWRNIVVSANYSRIWSKTRYPRFELIQSNVFPPVAPVVHFYETERNLSGQTDYTANIAVGYDYKEFSIRVSAYFQGPYLAFISNIESLDQYQKSFSRWDLALKQSFSKNLDVFLNINNFTNTIEGAYQSFMNLDRGGYLYGTSAELGLQLTFQ